MTGSKCGHGNASLLGYYVSSLVKSCDSCVKTVDIVTLVNCRGVNI